VLNLKRKKRIELRYKKIITPFFLLTKVWNGFKAMRTSKERVMQSFSNKKNKKKRILG
jgi:hypothetical protein